MQKEYKTLNTTLGIIKSLLNEFFTHLKKDCLNYKMVCHRSHTTKCARRNDSWKYNTISFDI